MYLETLTRLDGASSGVGFSTMSVSLPSSTERTPYFETLDSSTSMPRMTESVSFSTDLRRVSGADSPPGFQINSSPVKTKTGSFRLYSFMTSAIGTAVPYLPAGSWTV